MKTDFFTQFYPLLEGVSSLQLVLTRNGDVVSVSVMPRAKDLKDTAVKSIQPLMLSGSAEELDKHFLDNVQNGLAATTGFFSSLKEHEKSVSDAKAKSALAKAEQDAKKKEDDAKGKAKEKESKIIEANDKRIQEAITAAETLKAEGKTEIAYQSLKKLEKENPTLSEPVKKAFVLAIETTKAPSLF